MPSSCGQQQVGRACGSHLETVCLRTAFCLCGIWVTAKKRFPIFRPLKTNLWHCVCLNECVCVRVLVCVISLSKGSPLQRERVPFVPRLGLWSLHWGYRELLYEMTDEWCVCVCVCLEDRGKRLRIRLYVYLWGLVPVLDLGRGVIFQKGGYLVSLDSKGG